MMNKAAILVIYTGGTIGMKAHPVTGIGAVRFEHILEEVPNCKNPASG
jgi:L-asparaginase/Glu-tRNA(Gln) amidotransferase subunit D